MITAHVISHTHWDREWYLTFQQFRMKLVHMLDGLLDLLAEDPEYRYFMLDGQTIVLNDYLRIRPERADELRQAIVRGRILIGPWYLMPDEFLVSGESIIQNFLEGSRISQGAAPGFAHGYGGSMTVGYIPDTFGHIGQMPQILRGFGMEDASVWRGLNDEPCEFWWQSPDGSRVLMGYLREGYSNASQIFDSSDAMLVEVLQERIAALAPFAAGPNVLLMAGDDHAEASPHTSQGIAYANAHLQDAQVRHATLPEYFAAVRASVDLSALPTVRGELRASKRAPLLPAVLSTRMWIKQRNQAVETLLEKWAAPFSAWAEWISGETQAGRGLRHPEGLLREAWRLLIQCQPHDSICGCSIDAVHEEMRPRFDQAEQIGEEITTQSLVRLAQAVDTQPGRPASGSICSAVIVFNPSDIVRQDAVMATLIDLPETGSLELIDEVGTTIPFQMMGMGNSELLNMEMAPKEMRAGLKMVSADGVVMSLQIQNVHIQREGAVVSVQMTLGETASADPRAWKDGHQDLIGLLNDPGVTQYHVVARSAAAAEIRFAAPQIPPNGYRTFWVRSVPGDAAEPAQMDALTRALLPAVSRLAATPTGQKLVTRLSQRPKKSGEARIENAYYSVSVGADGSLDVTEKGSGTVYQGLNSFWDGGDRGDTYNYGTLAQDQPIRAVCKQVETIQEADRQMLRIQLEMQIPEGLSADRQTRAEKRVRMPITCTVTLINGCPRVDIHTELENTANDHYLRAHFPAPFAAPEAAYDGHFEVVQRMVKQPRAEPDWVEQPRAEMPQRAFTAVQDDRHVLVIANRGLPEATVFQNSAGQTEIAITLLRCVGWLSRDDFPDRKGHAGPFLATPAAQMHGKWAFDYAILSGAPVDTELLYHRAAAFGAPLRAVSSGLHEGNLPGSTSFLREVSTPPAVKPGAFLLSTVKRAEDGKGWIARGYNLSGQPTQVTLRVPRPLVGAEKVNLREERVDDLECDGQVMRFRAGAHEIVSLRVW